MLNSFSTRYAPPFWGRDVWHPKKWLQRRLPLYFHDMSMPVLLPRQHTGSRPPWYLKVLLATSGILLPTLHLHTKDSHCTGMTPLFQNSVWVLLRPTELSTFKEWTSGLLSLSENTRKSNHLQMKLQRLHFPLSYLKTLSVGPVGDSNSWPPSSQPSAQPSELPVCGIM